MWKSDMIIKYIIDILFMIFYFYGFCEPFYIYRIFFIEYL